MRVFNGSTPFNCTKNKLYIFARSERNVLPLPDDLQNQSKSPVVIHLSGNNDLVIVFPSLVIWLAPQLHFRLIRFVASTQYGRQSQKAAQSFYQPGILE